ncbi:MAG TPA: hypothetical protein VE860_14260 [Chthoniobacterales bacterium]|jgi:hypothetical protein|nr:hypothetical protein [Chthoniobacterales bacterium]
MPWRRLHGFELIPKVVIGVLFVAFLPIATFASLEPTTQRVSVRPDSLHLAQRNLVHARYKGSRSTGPTSDHLLAPARR